MLVKDNVAFRLPFARMLELELAPELDVAFAQADSLAETHALLWEEDGLDLVRELEEDGGGVEPLPRLVITADPEHSVAARAMQAGASGVTSKMVSARETAEAVQLLIGAGAPPGGPYMQAAAVPASPTASPNAFGKPYRSASEASFLRCLCSTGP